MPSFSDFMADRTPSFGDFMQQKKSGAPSVPGLGGMPLPGPSAPPNVKMQEVPYASGLTDAIVKPANSALKGYDEGVASGAKAVKNVARGAQYLPGGLIDHGVAGAVGDVAEQFEQVHQQSADELKGRGAEGIPGALYEAGGRAVPDLAKYTAASAALGPVAGMAAVGAATEADKGLAPAAMGAAEGAAMGGLLHVAQGASLPYRVGGMAAAGGGQAAASGGTPTDIAANAITMGAMAIPGGKGVSPFEARRMAKESAAQLETQKGVHAEREWAQTNVADAMGVRPLAEKAVPGTSPGMVKAKAIEIATAEMGGDPAKVQAAFKDKAVRQEYLNRAKESLPEGGQVSPDGASVPLGPDMRAAQANRKQKLAAKFGTRAEREAAYQEGLADAKRKPAAPPELDWPAPLKSAEESAAVLGDIPVQPAAESAKVFNKELGKRQPKQPGPVVPETGLPEQVLRTQDARERMAQQYGGKPWAELSNSERIQIDNWITEGNRGTVQPPPMATPEPAPRPTPGQPVPQQAAQPMSNRAPFRGLGEVPPALTTPTRGLPKVEAAAAVPSRASLPQLQESLRLAVERANRLHAEDVAYPSAEYAPDVQHIRSMISREELRQSPYVSDVVTPVFDRGESFYQGKLAEINSLAPLGTRRTRRVNQAGSLNIPNPFAPKQQNLTPSEKYFQEQTAIREKAKNGPDNALMERLKKARDLYRTTFNDTTVAMTDTLKPLDAAADASKTLRPTTAMNDLIDKAYRSSTIATKLIEKHGILDATDKVKNLDYLDQYMIARRAAELEANGFKTGRNSAMDAVAVKDFDSQIAIPATKDAPAQTYRQVADRFTAFNNTLLDMAVQSGVVDSGLAQHLRTRYKNYVPIDRVMDAVEHGHNNAKGQSQVASLSRQTIVQKLTGSDRIIDSSIVASIKRADRVLSQVTRNDAGRYLTDSLQKLDSGDGSLVKRLVPGETGPSDRTIHNFVNGEKQSYVVTPELAAAAKSLDVKQLGWVISKVFNPAVRVLKLGTTGLDPRFILRNLSKDIGHTMIVQEGGMAAMAKPGTYAEMGKALAGKSEAIDFMEGHGGGFTSFDIARGQVMPDIELRRAQKGSTNAVSYGFQHPIRTLGALVRESENLLGRSEQIGRARVWQTEYARATKAGYSKADAEIMATVESNNALPNYARAGSLGRTLNAMIPYFNARIQGSRSLVRGIENHPYRVAGKIMAAYGAVIAATAYNLSDDKRREIYFDMPAYQRESAIVIIGPNAKKDSKGRYEGVWSLPLPQGIDSLLSPGRKSVESMYGANRPGFNDLAEALIGALTPVTPVPVSKNVAVNVAAGLPQTIEPQVIKPAIEGMANYDFFQRRPIESGSMQDLPAVDRAYPYTSGTAKVMAQKVLPAVGLETSPAKVEHFVKGTFGGISQPLLNATDRAGMAAGAIPKQEPGGQNILDYTMSGVVGARGGEYDNQYYQLKRQAQDILTHRNLEILKANPNFAALPRATQQKLTRSAVAKARVVMDKVTRKGTLDDAPGPQKIQAMQGFLKQLQPQE